MLAVIAFIAVFQRSTRKMFCWRTFGHRLSAPRRNYCRNAINQVNALAQKQETKQTIPNVATIQREPNGSAVVIRFVYANEAIKFRKPFTCVRQAHESIPYSMTRVKEKIVQRIARKLERKGLAVPSDNFEVKLDGVNAEYENWEKLLDNFSEIESNLVLKIDNDTYAIEYNPPVIESLRLPSEVYPGFDCYPSKFDLCGDWNKYTFKWKQKLATSKKWIPCDDAESFIYRVPENAIGSNLQLTCSVTNKDGVVITERTSNVARVIDRAPNMEAIERRHKYTPYTLPDHQFRVVTYNLLADFYTDTDYSRTKLFPYCSPSLLAIEFRKALFIRELLGYWCDVMCLQEVDQEVFEHDFRHQFGRNHLKGVYTTKGPLPEGLATFYNSKKFRLISDHCVVLSDVMANDPIHHALYQRIQTDNDLCERMLPLRNIVQMLVLHCKSTDKYLVVANTHLYSQPDADDIRIVQAAIILNQIHSVIDRTIVEHKLDRNQVSAIFCGDMNSEPSDPIHQLVTHGIVQYASPNSILGYCQKAITLLTWRRKWEGFSIEQHRFRSAYDNTMHTIFTHSFASCLDYVYYSSDRHRLIQTVPLPSTDELKEYTGIPSEKFPSDHLALVADFEWIQNT